ncbi:MAG: hypothetical protein ASARMPRED_004030 [Alectoria sarmentosa]|nr:MAG: hypothetical protein ASARMPRED_004030 [Alectoria sarmentosa]
MMSRWVDEHGRFLDEQIVAPRREPFQLGVLSGAFETSTLGISTEPKPNDVSGRVPRHGLCLQVDVAVQIWFNVVGPPGAKTEPLEESSSLVAAQDCDASDPFDSAPAIAIDGAQALCNYVLTNCPGGFPAATLCVTNWCKTGCADPNNCCSCVGSLLVLPIFIRLTPSSSGSSSSDSRLLSSGPRAPQNAPPSSTYLNYCQSAATLGFSTLPNNTVQASRFLLQRERELQRRHGVGRCGHDKLCGHGDPASELGASSAEVGGRRARSFVDAGVLSSAGVSERSWSACHGCVAHRVARARRLGRAVPHLAQKTAGTTSATATCVE